ncbi:UNVERIFIED_CONTAM: hypothetical protein HDU68_004803 [Siphonaria sp. JEL0065]|nr:hypothetical protein HDU68_004803 [Siphonaria sp. JEL0065]
MKEEPNDLSVVIAISICFTVTELSYVLSAWSRGSEVVRRQLKRVYQLTVLYTRILPVLMVVQCISAPVDGLYYFISYSLNGVMICVFDTVLLYSFISFLGETHSEDIQLREDFRIISCYGIISSGICLTMIIVFIITALVPAAISNVFFSGLGLLSSFLFLSLTVMKVRVSTVSQTMSRTTNESNVEESKAVKDELSVRPTVRQSNTIT